MSQKPLYLVANWKSHKTAPEALNWLTTVASQTFPNHVETIVCPPFVCLPQMNWQLSQLKTTIALGAQNISPFPFGAYTGEVSASMIKDMVKYIIVGHSERRKYFHETNQDIANKITQVLEHNLTPILCLDEPYLHAQLDALDPEVVSKLIVAYEPLTAIGSGDPDTPVHAAQVATRIKDISKGDVPVLYGGSVTAENVHTFTNLPEISGALVGGASLDPQSWIDLVTAASL